MCELVKVKSLCKKRKATLAEAVADIAAEEARYFTVLDTMKGYHQSPLDEESQAHSYNLYHAIWAFQVPPSTI